MEGHGIRGPQPAPATAARGDWHTLRTLLPYLWQYRGRVVLVAVCGADAEELREGSEEHRDFLEVNRILAATEDRVKPELLTGFLGLVDRWLGAADDVVAMWNVARARDAAWSNARTLWALRASPTFADEFVRTLDRSTGLAGRGLLRPLPPVHRLLLDRLRRRFR